MPSPLRQPPPPRSPKEPGAVRRLALAMLAALLLLDAPAMERSALAAPPDAAWRAPALRALGPVARLSRALRLDRPRAAAEALERRFLEPPPPILPDPPAEDAGDFDDDLDEFLDLSSAGADEGKCCQCDNVANCQFQFPMTKAPSRQSITGNWQHWNWQHFHIGNI